MSVLSPDSPVISRKRSEAESIERSESQLASYWLLVGAVVTVTELQGEIGPSCTSPSRCLLHAWGAGRTRLHALLPGAEGRRGLLHVPVPDVTSNRLLYGSIPHPSADGSCGAATLSYLRYMYVYASLYHELTLVQATAPKSRPPARTGRHARVACSIALAPTTVRARWLCVSWGLPAGCSSHLIWLRLHQQRSAEVR